MKPLYILNYALCVCDHKAGAIGISGSSWGTLADKADIIGEQQLKRTKRPKLLVS